MDDKFILLNQQDNSYNQSLVLFRIILINKLFHLNLTNNPQKPLGQISQQRRTSNTMTQITKRSIRPEP